MERIIRFNVGNWQFLRIPIYICIYIYIILYGAIDDLYQKKRAFFKIEIIFSMCSIRLSMVYFCVCLNSLTNR